MNVVQHANRGEAFWILLVKPKLLNAGRWLFTLSKFRFDCGIEEFFPLILYHDRLSLLVTLISSNARQMPQVMTCL